MAAQFDHKVAGEIVNFRAEQIDAMKQFHVVRRLAPVLAEIAVAFGSVKLGDAMKATAAPEATAANVDPATAAAGFAGVANALAKLSDDEANYVLHTLLSHVMREQPGQGWHRVSNGTALMFNDLKLPALMFLAYKSLQENLGDFFAAIPSDLKAATLKASGL